MRYKKNIIIGVMCIAVLIMGLGYALLSTQIDISGSTAVTSTWKIEFSDIRTKELYGGATNAVAPTASGTAATFEVDLVLPGDYVMYEIDITNYGDIDAEVKGATYSVSGSDAIYVYVDGVKKGTKLPSCEGLDTCPTITMTLKVGYDSGINGSPSDIRKDIEFSIEVGQYVEDNPTEEGDLIPDLVEPQVVLYGDANNDGVVDAKDTLKIKQYISGSITLEEFGTTSFINADVNLDGDVDAVDLNHINKYLASYDYDTGVSSYNLPYRGDYTKYTITYNLHGGTIDKSKAYTTYSNSTLPYKLETPTREGYTFVGWTGSNGDTPQLKVTITKGTIGNLVYDANWQAN